MDLRTYTQSLRGAASALAAAIAAPPALVSQWANGTRPVAPERCVAIERATHGAVMRWDLRPNDWRDIWPELAERPDAPKPAKEAA
jgi:DNA-binding transcriptional regulator YdaS (Cro superfamily)